MREPPYCYLREMPNGKIVESSPQESGQAFPVWTLPGDKVDRGLRTELWLAEVAASSMGRAIVEYKLALQDALPEGVLAKAGPRVRAAEAVLAKTIGQCSRYTYKNAVQPLVDRDTVIANRIVELAQELYADPEALRKEVLYLVQNNK